VFFFFFEKNGTSRYNIILYIYDRYIIYVNN